MEALDIASSTPAHAGGMGIHLKINSYLVATDQVLAMILVPIMLCTQLADQYDMIIYL